MARRRLGFTWVAFALALASCVSPEELRREDEATCAGMAFTPALRRLLVVQIRRLVPAMEGRLSTEPTRYVQS